MTINDLRQPMPQIENIIPINREFEYKEQKCVFAFLGKEKSENKFTAWIIAQNPYNDLKYSNHSLHKTNRQSLNNNFKVDIDLPLMKLSKIKIGNYELDVRSSTTNTPYFGVFKSKKESSDINYTINYIFAILNKCNLGELENSDINDLCIFEYVFSNSIESLNINPNDTIILYFKHRIKKIKINKTLNLKMGEHKGKKYSFRDKTTKEKQYIYIDRLVHYDVWHEAKKQFDSPEYIHKCKKVLTDEQIDQMKQEYFKSLPNLCPHGMDLAVLEYETEKEINLNVYTKKFLNEKLKTNSGSSMLLLLHSDSKSLKGYRVRSCIIESIEKDFDGIMNLEIFDGIESLSDEELEI